MAAYPNSSVSSGLSDVLKSASTALLVSRSGILLLFAQFMVLAAYAVSLVAGMLVERRRADSALLRSRGASSGHLAVLALGEALLLAAPAVAVAPFAAQAVVGLVGGLGPLAGAGAVAVVGIDATAWLAALGAGLACVAVFTLPALPGMTALSGVRSALGRQVGRTLAGRLGLDLVLVVVAAIAIWQLRLYGAPLTRSVRGDLGIDPLLVAAPAIGLLAGAVAATRIVPRLGEIAEKAFGHNSGLATPLLARQIGRRPLRYTRVALLLMLAASLGTFAATFGATWTRSQSDQATYRAAADMRLTITGQTTQPAWSIGPAYAAVPGVKAATGALRQGLEVGRDVTDGVLLGVDPGAVSKLPSLGLASFSSSETEAMAAIGQTSSAPLQPIPGRPTQLAINVTTALVDLDAGDPNGMTAQEPPYAYCSVVVADANGLHRFDSSPIPLSSSSAWATVDLTTSTAGSVFHPAYPLSLEAVEIAVAGSGPSRVGGTFTLNRVESSDPAAGPERQPIGLTLGRSGWSWSRVERQAITSVTAPSDNPGLISLGDSAATPPVPLDSFGDSGAIFRYWAVPDGPAAIPAIADQAFLDATGAHTGDTILASRSGFKSPVKIVATASSFPTLDPTTPFLVVDRSALELVDYATWGILDNPAEWWLTLEPGHAAEVASALGAGPYPAATIVNREPLEHELLGDPVALGVIGALILGSLAALALAVIGFLAAVAFMTRERLGELALLRALGESERGIVGMLALEEAFLLAYGLLAGAALGLLIGWLVIPFSTLTSSGTPALPPPTLVAPWGEILLIAVPIVAVLAAGALLIIATGARGEIPPAIRGREVGQ
ncbi:MAG TPA: FtsX-like permease family protein [Candidatus Limnocylindrales bacterium]